MIIPRWREEGGKKGRSETKQCVFVYSLNYLRPCAHQRMEIYIGGARRRRGTNKVRAKDESLLLQTLVLLGFFYRGYVFACCGSKYFHDVKVPRKSRLTFFCFFSTVLIFPNWNWTHQPIMTVVWNGHKVFHCKTPLNPQPHLASHLLRLFIQKKYKPFFFQINANFFTATEQINPLWPLCRTDIKPSTAGYTQRPLC